MSVIDRAAEKTAQVLIQMGSEPFPTRARKGWGTLAAGARRSLLPLLKKVVRAVARYFWPCLCAFFVPVVFYCGYRLNLVAISMTYQSWLLSLYIAAAPWLFSGPCLKAAAREEPASRRGIWPAYGAGTALSLGAGAALVFLVRRDYEKIYLLNAAMPLVLFVFGGLWLAAGLRLGHRPAIHCLFASTMAGLFAVWQICLWYDGSEPHLLVSNVCEDALKFMGQGLLCYLLWRFLLALYLSFKRQRAQGALVQGALPWGRTHYSTIAGCVLLGGALLYAVYVPVAAAWIHSLAPDGVISRVDTARPWDIRFEYDDGTYRYTVQVGGVWRFLGKMDALDTVFGILEEVGGVQGHEEGTVWLKPGPDRGGWAVGCSPPPESRPLEKDVPQ